MKHGTIIFIGKAKTRQDKRIRIIDGNIEISQGGSHDRDK